MKRFLYFLALTLALFTAVAYVVGKNWEEEAIVQKEELSSAQQLAMLKKRAKASDFEAQYRLGLHYEGREDYLSARKWYRVSASKGQHAGAKYKLAQMYLDGRGVENDPTTAIKWMRQSANQGDGRAQYVLGIAIRDGWERKPDWIEAYKWFYLANRKRAKVLAEDPCFDTQKALNELQGKMSRFNVEEGVKRAKRWLKRSK